MTYDEAYLRNAHARSCRSKRAYPSRSAARRVARLVQAMYGRMTPYRCTNCSQYHVGHGWWNRSEAA